MSLLIAKSAMSGIVPCCAVSGIVPCCAVSGIVPCCAVSGIVPCCAVSGIVPCCAVSQNPRPFPAQGGGTGVWGVLHCQWQRENCEDADHAKEELCEWNTHGQ